MSLVLHNLSIGYPNRVIASQLQVVATAGNLICLLGKNGCGKSTLLRTLAGLQPALGGEILFGDSRNARPETRNGKRDSRPADERSKTLALCLTERESLEETRVEQVVALGRYPYTSFMGKLTAADKQIIEESMQLVGIEHKANDYFNCLSDGEKQCVLIAKALAQQTPIILLDEPTAHLDLPNRIRIMLLLKRLAKEQQKIIIISTHELDLAQRTADQIWLMSEGNLLAGSPPELLAADAFNKAFDNVFAWLQDGLL